MILRATILLLLGLSSALVAQPYVRVTAPNGGEVWQFGSAHMITWTDNITGNFAIELFHDSSFSQTITGATPNTGSYTWQIPADLAEGTNYRVKISSLDNPLVSDLSDSTFTLMIPPSLHIVSPNGGETWCAGDTALIAWTSVNVSESIRVELKRTYPSASWITLVSAMENTGSYPWVVAGPSSTTARIRIRGIVHGTYSDTSDANFNIEPPFATPQAVINGSTANGFWLRWTRLGCLDHYEVWNSAEPFGENFLVATTTDTMYAVDTGGDARIQFYYVIAYRQ